MAMQRSSIRKIEVVLTVAENDQSFKAALSADPVSALRQKGFDLSNGEVASIIDIVRGTNVSPLAARLVSARQRWQALR